MICVSGSLIAYLHDFGTSDVHFGTPLPQITPNGSTQTGNKSIIYSQINETGMTQKMRIQIVVS